MTTRKPVSPPEPQPPQGFTQADLDRCIAEGVAKDARREVKKKG